MSNRRIEDALKALISSMKILREEGVLINKKDVTCQLGEWLVEIIYDGKRAYSGIQKGWDVEVNGKFIQVKCHAKDAGNSAAFSVISSKSLVHIDELIIIIFTHDYKLKNFYKVPWEVAVHHIRPKGKAQREEINWSDLGGYAVNLDKLPHQEIIRLFR